MASLRDMVSEYQDDLRNGIAWLAFWREGRSWQAEAFHLDLDDTLYPEDRARLAEIQATDPRAVVVNGYYSGYLGEEMSVAELAAGVRHHYDNGLNNIAPFMEAHSDELPPDVLEAAREKAHAAGLPFYERPYRGDDIDPYTYNGHMSIEDYELMQKLMEQDRERREPVSEVFSIMIDNRAEAQSDGPHGYWLDLPTTAEKLQEAMREIHISTDNPQDFFIAGFSCPEDRHLAIPYDMVLAADVDELNFLAARLDTLDAATTTETTQGLMKAGSAFCYFSPIKPGFLAQEEATTARELVTQVLYPEWDIINSSAINFVNWGIAHQCEDPVKAMQFLNFAFTSKEFNDLLNFGIEGKHYAKMDGSDVMITYPEGVDATNCGYHLAMGWANPNQFVGSVWEGNPEDVWQQYKDCNAASVWSKAYGFIPDTSAAEVANTQTALTNVYSTYQKSIECGAVDPETIIPQMNSELYAAGLQEYMDEKQRQLDEWASANGVS